MPSNADWTRFRSEPHEVATECFRILFRGPDALRLLQLLHPTNRTFGSGIEDRLEWCHAAGSSYAFRNPQAWRIFWPRDREFSAHLRRQLNALFVELRSQLVVVGRSEVRSLPHRTQVQKQPKRTVLRGFAHGFCSSESAKESAPTINEKK